MKLSLPTKAQWISIVKNVVLVALAAALAALQSGSSDFKAILTVAVMAGLKVLEKVLFASTVQ